MIDDGLGVQHSDCKLPEYETLDQISLIKWEEWRGLGREFGYNRGEGETIAPDQLIYLVADIVGKNGNSARCRSGSAIPQVQKGAVACSGCLAEAKRRCYLRHSPFGDELRGWNCRWLAGSFSQQKGFRGFGGLDGYARDEHGEVKGAFTKNGDTGSQGEPHCWSQQDGDVRIALPATRAVRLRFENCLAGVLKRNGSKGIPVRALMCSRS